MYLNPQYCRNIPRSYTLWIVSWYEDCTILQQCTWNTTLSYLTAILEFQTFSLNFSQSYSIATRFPVPSKGLEKEKIALEVIVSSLKFMTIPMYCWYSWSGKTVYPIRIQYVVCVWVCRFILGRVSVHGRAWIWYFRQYMVIIDNYFPGAPQNTKYVTQIANYR